MLTAVVVTGASRGFGRAFAVAAGSILTEDVAVFLAGRDVPSLRETQQSMEAARKIAGCGEGSLSTSMSGVDFSDARTAGAWSAQTCDVLAELCPHRVILLNNAASVGPLESCSSMAVNPEATQRAWNFNVTSSLAISACFVRRLVDAAPPAPPKSTFLEMEPAFPDELVVVNVSSLAALEPFKGWGAYCAGKAAREMWHRVAAKENEGNRRLRVLNYAPWPMDTDMHRETREKGYSEVRQPAIDAYEAGALVDPMASATKLLDIIEGDGFTSGAHVDFYDA